MNRLAMNRLAMNRLAMNRLAMNRLAMNRLPMNRLPMNRLAMNRLPMNRLPMNRLPMNRLPMNRLPMNRLPMNRLPMNRLPMTRLEDRLRVERDGTITVLSGKVELGQGIRTAFARLVADGLRVPVAAVRVELGDTATAPWDMGTFGSLSVRSDGALLARAAACARRCLIERAAWRWSLPAELLAADAGCVVAPDGRRASYAELAEDAPLAGEIRDDVPIAAPSPPAGEPRHDDRWAVVTGGARFAADLRFPGMLHGCVLHAPALGARLVALDDAAARAVPGVVAVVRDGNFAGVVAERPGQARAGVRALVAEWAEALPSPRVERRLVLRDDPVADALATASAAVDAHYELPHVANASLGTTTALAEVHRDRAEIHAATQRPFGVRDEVAKLLGIAPDRVRVIAEPAAGSFGRNNSCDAALEAARLSRAVGRPVLVAWSRADELRVAPSRPRLSAHIQAGLDETGRLIAWSSDIATNPHVYFGDLASLPDPMVALTCARNAVPPYRLAAARVAVRVSPAEIRTAALRSLSAAPNVFAIESAIDELASAAGIDPLELRLRNTDDPRLRRVLARVAERSDWARRPRGDGIGRGLACAIYNDTYVAQVAEIAIAAGRPRVRRAWCALDCGVVVDPDGARNQIEGSIQHAISWALVEQLRQDRGRVLAHSWDDYPIARFHDAPESIDIVFAGDGGAPTGVGEPGAVPFGAAIANAVAAACGIRVRSQPLRDLRVGQVSDPAPRGAAGAGARRSCADEPPDA